MVLHAVVLIGLFAPTASLLAQTMHDLTQWIPTAVSLLSIGIGVWIANPSIHSARRLTEWSFKATSERDHERWVLDQRKVEWKELLTKTSEIEHAVPTLVMLPDGFDSVEQMLLLNIRELLEIRAHCLFIADVLNAPDTINAFVEFVRKLGRGAQSMKEKGEARRDPGTPGADKMTLFREQEALFEELRATYLSLRDWTISIAQQDLSISQPLTPTVYQ